MSHTSPLRISTLGKMLKTDQVKDLECTVRLLAEENAKLKASLCQKSEQINGLSACVSALKTQMRIQKTPIPVAPQLEDKPYHNLEKEHKKVVAKYASTTMILQKTVDTKFFYENVLKKLMENSDDRIKVSLIADNLSEQNLQASLKSNEGRNFSEQVEIYATQIRPPFEITE